MKYLILAGGSGTRLWPLSRNKYPKQFLSLINDKSMLQNTALRVSDKGNDIFIITGENTSHIIKQQIQQIYTDYPAENILLEPTGRNTAPAIAYSCLSFDDNDIIAVLSADAHIANEKEFNKVLSHAQNIAEQGFIATLGIVPDSPKTGYGYIKRSQTKICNGYKVDKFVEKPYLITAEGYLADGTYYWNAGIFVFRVKTFLDELSKYAPSISSVTEMLRQKIKSGQQITTDDYMQYEKISIDYAVMEHSDKIAVVEANIGWNDIGSFKSLYDLLPHDNNGNVYKTASDKVISIDSANNYIYSEDRTIVTLGVNNMIITDTPDALLIADAEHSEQIKQAVDILNERNDNITSSSVVSYKTWGYVRHLYNDNDTEVTEITILPGCIIPNHYHKHANENITIVSGTAYIECEDKVIELKKSESIRFSKNDTHIIKNPSNKENMKFIEVKTAKNLDKSDMYYDK